MVNIYYFQTEPNDEFLGGAVSTKELREWVKAKGAALPPTPQHVNFENIDYVGVRNYLDEISNEVVKRLSDDRIVHEAIQLLIANPDYPYEPRERDLILNYSAPEPARLICARWLLNRDTWSEWRNLIREGLDVGKLALLNGRTRKAIPWPGALNQNKKADQSEGGAEPMANGGFITEVQLTPACPPVTPAPGALVTLGETGKTGPKFSMTKRAMLTQHMHEWPTIERDMSDAKRNGLAAAKAGVRGWHEPDAMEWARANNKLENASKSSNSLMQAVNNMTSLPSFKHKLEG